MPKREEQKQEPQPSAKATSRPDPIELARLLDQALSRGEEAFVDVLVSAVKKVGYSTVAREAGIRRESLFRYERGEHRPQFRVILALLKSMDVSFRVTSATGGR